MSVEWKFIDTNVPVYLFDGDAPDKRIEGLQIVNPFRNGG